VQLFGQRLIMTVALSHAVPSYPVSQMHIPLAHSPWPEHVLLKSFDGHVLAAQAAPS
jgi:hypothetical protein